MSKTKTKWVCQKCGYETVRYIGKCPDCGSWGALAEEISEEIELAKAKNKNLAWQFDCEAKPLNLISNELSTSRISSQSSETDRVLGGGLVEGSLILLSGEPGIGKSTLLLEISNSVAKIGKRVLYVSAEESVSQIKIRSNRLKIFSENIFIYSQTSLELIKKQIEKVKPDIVVIDSIQTIQKSELQSVSGSATQIRECTCELMDIAKSKNITTIVVGHVTKDGNIAGPKILEHMVDVTLYFEGDKFHNHRILRCIKNRFGPTDEIGMFSMESSGLVEVLNPSEIFLSSYKDNSVCGNAIVVCNEGSRPLLFEIEALVGNTPYPAARRVANGFDYNRLLQILAVLEKRLGLNLSRQDVYLNVAGGISLNEPSCDLAVAMAIFSCAKSVSISSKVAICGEIALSGAIRKINNLEKRIIQAEKSGFDIVVVPDQSLNLDKSKHKIKIEHVSTLNEAISKIFGDFKW